ncbi:M23 family metallopeptidase [Roseovarius aestuariivivens]|uniref:M23 family metallopeptidase n=1 Tax=Roseovarius aestuariivivens TaxID=1888910 RepID=UPI00107FF4A4|nr:M23 family metallopeptidase [Roseovarius aestuariivivens]
MKFTAGAILGLTLAAPALADPPALSLPIDCTLGTTCYIEDYVDLDPGPDQRDYTCGLKSRDGHRGTDIHLLSFEAMEAGVDVLAAAPGRVAAMRDGMPDTPVTAATRAEIAGRECGNAVRIDHGDGWQTLYCHMKNGSLSVREGQEVETGMPLGQVGLSGLTNAPHIHLSVLKNGAVVDPFLPEAIDGACGSAVGDGLWHDAPAYDRAGLFTAGFSTTVPEFDAVKSGDARVTDAAPNAALVLYGHVFYARPGDTLALWADGPGGRIFETELLLDAPQAQLFRAYGRRAPAGGWSPGIYRGYVRLDRDGRIIASRHANITVR